MKYKTANRFSRLIGPLFRGGGEEGGQEGGPKITREKKNLRGGLTHEWK